MEDLRGDWHRLKGQYMMEILRNPVMHYLVTGADQVIAYQAAEIARLRGELDNYQGRMVLHCTEANLDEAMIIGLDSDEGTILRATDTGREMELHGGTWLPR